MIAPRVPTTDVPGPQLHAHVQSRLDAFVAARRRRLEVLEAGCGSLSHLRLRGDLHIVGIDVSARALAQNDALHERIEADLQTCEIDRSRYDLVVCCDVLEHLATPAAVVRKLLAAVKPDGLVLLAVPNVRSMKGLVAKYTPFRFHVLVHRLIYGAKAGTAPGYEVFPTYLRSAIAPGSLVAMARRAGLDVEFFTTYEGGMQRRLRERCGLVGRRWQLFRLLVRSLSLGTIDAAASDCLLLLRRPASGADAVSGDASGGAVGAAHGRRRA
jgi:SAM-dependent methyltransferase